MTKNTLSIIIVTFNSEKYIENCIDSIEKCDHSDLSINIIVIDNFSNDKTVTKLTRLSKKYENIKIIKNKKNTGFAYGVNQGIQLNRHADYFLLLNPDTRISKNAINELFYCMKRNNSGICGGSTIDFLGKNTGSYFRYPNIKVGIFDFTNLRKICNKDKWHKYFYYLDKKNNSNCFSVDVVTGGFMLIKNSTIKKIGLFDDSFFMYLEDVDYCIRAKKSGIKIFHSEKARIRHFGGGSSKNKDRIRHTSWLISRKKLFIKHFGLFDNLLIQPLFIFDDIIILVRYLFLK